MEFSRRTLGMFAASAGLPRFEPPAARAPVGLVLSHEQFPTARLLDFARQAEDAGFSFVWASDHLQPWQDDQGHSMFPWLTLALVGERTRRLAFGSGVTCPSYRHHPSEVAQAFASLELLAPGRTFLGVGTGEAVNEQAGTGQYGRYAERHDRLAEAIELIRRLWTGERVTFRGRFFTTDQLKLYDLPSKPPPVYVAAQGPKSARLAGRYGDGWITQAGASLDPALRNAFAEGARAAGKNPDAMPKWAELFAVAGDQREIDLAAARWRFTVKPADLPNPEAIQEAAQATSLAEVASRWAVGTDPAVHVEAVRKLLDAGVTPVLHFPQQDPGAAIEFYRTRVLPRL
ncbi:F420-dependent hydroxymycolic acid dehydrogenase [Amycolatopsis thermophila]|uniref:TAT-translocated FGD2 family F420-dependent dehydrogenase n=1 Tax=Amycolatopsis thermophila TaxID=206084 RepID=A0ABU0EPV0_9PSEU|nr:F420-dependent hydroxymycolic acid dehydrogenase [Amycolatopsis thermophila]MDQ0377315.1 TAT-translocated FGD2 family F420-dependent dehydrogenase [Amycolatopsis thermophila]